LPDYELVSTAQKCDDKSNKKLKGSKRLRYFNIRKAIIKRHRLSKFVMMNGVTCISKNCHTFYTNSKKFLRKQPQSKNRFPQTITGI